MTRKQLIRGYVLSLYDTLDARADIIKRTEFIISTMALALNIQNLKDEMRRQHGNK
jgi:hypothetical protein